MRSLMPLTLGHIECGIEPPRGAVLRDAADRGRPEVAAEDDGAGVRGAREEGAAAGGACFLATVEAGGEVGEGALEVLSQGEGR